MLQLRSLGAIPLTQYGADRGPRLVAPSTIDTPYVPSTSTYPTTVPPAPTGGGGGGTAYPSYKPPTFAYQSNAPTVQPNAPIVQPSLPAPDAMPTNPTNPSMPAPAGTQVTPVNPASVGPAPWHPAWYKFGMSPKLWGLGLLGLAVALIGGVAAHHAHTHH